MRPLILSLMLGLVLSACQREPLVDTSLNEIDDINSIDDFNNVIDQGVTFVFFHASWCKNCEEQRPAVEANSDDSELDFVKFIEIEYEENKEITKAHDVPGFPTMLIFKDGTEVDRLIGKGHSIQQIKDALLNHK